MWSQVYLTSLKFLRDSLFNPNKDQQACIAARSDGDAAPTRKQPPRNAKKHVRYSENVDVIPSFFFNVSNALLILAITLVTFELVTPSKASELPTKAAPINVLCVKGGIFIRNLNPFSDIQACAQNHCIETRIFDDETTIMFPASVCLHAYDVRVKASFEHENIIISRTCPPSPFCEMIDCNFCAL
ncbi:unnamed protein product [Haemonchus placei]|uniref:Late nodulin n=1 Tax=Haemonchus placei TaxID=6290 RepID=A0A0N4W7H7_HAEPC|nr:unnamed protein product [Haemonchus placei]